MPKKAAIIAPAIIERISGEIGFNEERERVFVLVNKETTKVTMLTAKFKGTACFAEYRRGPFKTGNRYSAPPSPISPPTIAIGIEIKNANQIL